ncbi:ABC transporter permease [Prosthecomicrobium hirschii]|uniref:Multidrug ABC transporter substrate-binding protein n=1 Tax=Prosthecodimorpha hirschii TaxID=665126 RepID=A0A0P6W263_9HYPH|nr:ABC transporter permease [Prosthecomicrobium hirschii]KPL52328.1 multidrug ABC transporter substrate-binding protein [Prosthecomicrobium hirschii]MCW1843276.1 ABC transporter permease [Prosthecomicrobium hirschii]TPQ49246.1 multidrug ABC transporter substrate-binding protein [Prosthecomicrobium hirschii]
MSFIEATRMALAALTANWLRSALTMLGMVIGVAAVIATFAIGVGAQETIGRIMTSLGSNIIVVWPGNSNLGGARGPSGSSGRLSERDATALRDEVSEALVVAPSVAGNVQVVYGNLNWSTRVNGVEDDFFVARDWEIDTGRSFTEAEERRGAKVAIIGRTVAEQLFGEDDPIGSVIRIQKMPAEVIGVMKSKGQTMFGQDQDDVIFVPLDTARQRLLGRFKSRPDQIDSITLKANSAEALDEVEKSARAVLDRRFAQQTAGDLSEAYNLRNLTQLVEAQTSAARTLSRLLGVVATIALVVGGIGIMNIMLVSVTERTREIGLRMAVGARRRDIRLQFLIEAMVLALVGGTIGILIGAATSVTLARMTGWPLVIAPDVIGLAFAFSAGVGVFFGWYPATKAARLDPIEALRYE